MNAVRLRRTDDGKNFRGSAFIEFGSEKDLATGIAEWQRGGAGHVGETKADHAARTAAEEANGAGGRKKRARDEDGSAAAAPAQPKRQATEAAAPEQASAPAVVPGLVTGNPNTTVRIVGVAAGTPRDQLKASLASKYGEVTYVDLLRTATDAHVRFATAEAAKAAAAGEATAEGVAKGTGAQLLTEDEETAHWDKVNQAKTGAAAARANGGGGGAARGGGGGGARGRGGRGRGGRRQ